MEYSINNILWSNFLISIYYVFGYIYVLNQIQIKSIYCCRFKTVNVLVSFHGIANESKCP